VKWRTRGTPEIRLGKNQPKRAENLTAFLQAENVTVFRIIFQKTMKLTKLKIGWK